MITFILLLIIYIAFISLGLPDAILGSAWPVIRSDFGLPMDAAGLITITITGGTIVSSLLSGTLVKRFGTGIITFISCMFTALALLGISFSQNYWWIVLLAIPLGLGAGSVDSALNNYVALHFKAHHMNWLHCFWGVGASLGPIIMGQSLLSNNSWRAGYKTISMIQLGLAFLFLLTLPIWKKVKERTLSQTSSSNESIDANATDNMKLKDIFKVKGLSYALTTFAIYCGMEFSVGLWGSSYLIDLRGFSSEKAASWIALYYGGITLGRFLSGFVSMKLSNKQMIRGGLLIALASSSMMLMFSSTLLLGISFVLVGLGLAPIFPSMLHETPSRFGSKNSQSIIGFQMAAAYTGGALLPPLLGVILSRINLYLFPVILVIFSLIMILSSEKLNKLCK